MPVGILVGMETPDGKVTPAGIAPPISLGTLPEGSRPVSAVGSAPPDPLPRALVRAAGRSPAEIGQGNDADSLIEGEILIPMMSTVTISL